MVLGQDHRHRLVAHGLLFEARPQRRRQPREPSEGHIEAPGEQFGRGSRETALVAGHQLMAGRELAGPLQHPRPGAEPRGVHVDQQRPGLPERGEQIVLRRERPPGVRHQPLPVRRQRHLPGGPDEQLGAQLPLQPPYVPAERLLGDVEPGGGAGEVEFLGDREEGAQEAGIGHDGEFTTRARESVRRRCWTP